jgi:hypothetical protein
LISAIIQAVLAAFSVFKQERAIYNRPDMVKNSLDTAKQQARDALRNAEAVLADPKATPAQHAEALRQIRLAGS